MFQWLYCQGATTGMIGRAVYNVDLEKRASILRPRNVSETSLTPRETECLLRLAQGYRSEAIAYELGVKRVTVDLHIANAKRKLQANTREHAVAIAMHYKLISPTID